MLVYSLKKAALPPPVKTPISTPLQNSNPTNEKNTKGNIHSSSIQKNGINQLQTQEKKLIPDQFKNKEFVNGQSKINPAFSKTEAPGVSNLSVEVPLRKTLSSPTSHPLFGDPSPHKPRIDVVNGPCWYTGQATQLQKRKPEDASSRHSSSKKNGKIQRSGLKKIKEMSKKIRILGEFTSLRISRVNSREFPDKGLQKQLHLADMMKA